MGHKVHPIGIRLGISKDWNSKWYANKAEFAGYLAADLKVRDMLRKKLAHACGGANYIETVWGRGYVLRDPDERAEAA